MTLVVVSSLFLCSKGRDSNKEGANQRFAEENSPVNCFRWRGNERSEAIGTVVPRKNPFRRANKREFAFAGSLLILCSVMLGIWILSGVPDSFSPAGSVGASEHLQCSEVSTGDPHPTTRSTCREFKPFTQTKNAPATNVAGAFLAGAVGFEC